MYYFSVYNTTSLCNVFIFLENNLNITLLKLEFSKTKLFVCCLSVIGFLSLILGPLVSRTNITILDRESTPVCVFLLHCTTFLFNLQLHLFFFILCKLLFSLFIYLGMVSRSLLTHLESFPLLQYYRCWELLQPAA